MPRQIEDLTGQTLGMQKVLGIGTRTKRGRVRWKAKCVECGSIRTTTAANLKQYDNCICVRTTHGYTRRNAPQRPEYTMWREAKSRAKRLGLRFTLKVTDIVIPKRCPVFGIVLKTNRKTSQDNSPSLDRIVPSQGYTKKNTWVISMLANRKKGDCSIADMKRIIKALERKHG